MIDVENENLSFESMMRFILSLFMDLCNSIKIKVLTKKKNNDFEWGLLY